MHADNNDWLNDKKQLYLRGGKKASFVRDLYVLFFVKSITGDYINGCKQTNKLDKILICQLTIINTKVRHCYAPHKMFAFLLKKEKENLLCH